MMEFLLISIIMNLVIWLIVLSSRLEKLKAMSVQMSKKLEKTKSDEKSRKKLIEEMAIGFRARDAREALMNRNDN